MKNRKTLLIRKNYDEKPHYLLLNQDPEGNNWEFPEIPVEDHLENYMEEVLGISKHELDRKTHDREIIGVKVSKAAQPVINTEKYAGGLFLKKRDIKQLLENENNLKTVEQHAG